MHTIGTVEETQFISHSVYYAIKENISHSILPNNIHILKKIVTKHAFKTNNSTAWLKTVFFT